MAGVRCSVWVSARPKPRCSGSTSSGAVFKAMWQRCRVPFIRVALAHAGKSGRQVVSALIATAFSGRCRGCSTAVVPRRRPVPRKDAQLAALMDTAEDDVLAYMTFPAAHRTKSQSTNPLERVNDEIKRRTDVVGIFPNEASIERLVEAILLQQNDEWAVQRSRGMTLESIAPIGDDAAVSLPTLVARPSRLKPVTEVAPSEAAPPIGTRSGASIPPAWVSPLGAPQGSECDTRRGHIQALAHREES